MDPQGHGVLLHLSSQPLLSPFVYHLKALPALSVPYSYPANPTDEIKIMQAPVTGMPMPMVNPDSAQIHALYHSQSVVVPPPQNRFVGGIYLVTDEEKMALRGYLRVRPGHWNDRRSGDVVIYAGENEFCFPRKVLIDASPILKAVLVDLESRFHFPRGAERGQPIPTLRFPEKGEDMINFFKALFSDYDADGEDAFWDKTADEFPYSTLSGICKLAVKYQCEEILETGIWHFAQHFPSTWTDVSPKRRKPTLVPEPELFELYDMVSLVHTMKTPFMLPFLYYEIIRRSSLQQLQAGGFKLANGQVVRLPPQDQQRLLNAYARQSRAIYDECSDWVAERVNLDEIDCQRSNREGLGPDEPDCNDTRMAIKADLKHIADTQPDLCDPFHYSSWQADNLLCNICKFILEGQYSKSRRRYFLQLPEIFGLPSWKELRTIERKMLNDASPWTLFASEFDYQGTTYKCWMSDYAPSGGTKQTKERWMMGEESDDEPECENDIHRMIQLNMDSAYGNRNVFKQMPDPVDSDEEDDEEDEDAEGSDDVDMQQ